MHYIAKRVLLVFFIAYFAVDAVFGSFARPLAALVSRLKIWPHLRRRIVSLRPYPTLALFIVPLVVLEPVKPIAAYLIGTDRYVSGMALLIIGEMLKLVIVERLFNISRRKLMTIPAFARAYGWWRSATDWLKSTTIWRDARKLMREFGIAILNAGRQITPRMPRYVRVPHVETRKHNARSARILTD